MGKKLTTEEVIARAKEVHGDKYDYSLMIYTNLNSKVKIVCPIHEIFEQKISNHIYLKHGCYKCNKSHVTNDDFINKSNITHNYKYDYSQTTYIKNNVEVNIICKQHGIFNQLPYNHVRGAGCPTCSSLVMNKYKRSNTETFIHKAKICHKDKYDYSKSIYHDRVTDLTIICKLHGEFTQKPYKHLEGVVGCKKCMKRGIKSPLSTNEFILRSKIIHNNKYDYTKSTYTLANNSILIICPTHGEFHQKAINHLMGYGCKKCKSSKGEIIILKLLSDNNVPHIYQHKFDDCIYKRKLLFDFYIPKYNMCIEFDGEQHFKPINIFGGESKYTKQKLYDNIKDEYCKNNNIRLLRIPYYEINNIYTILNIELFSKIPVH